MRAILKTESSRSVAEISSREILAQRAVITPHAHAHKADGRAKKWSWVGSAGFATPEGEDWRQFNRLVVASYPTAPAFGWAMELGGYNDGIEKLPRLWSRRRDDGAGATMNGTMRSGRSTTWREISHAPKISSLMSGNAGGRERPDL
jgi:hypothetical protein